VTLPPSTLASKIERALRIARLKLTGTVRPELAVREGLSHAFLLHDIGMLGLPEAIVRKPGRLTPSEARVMQTHTTLGEALIRRLRILSPLVRDVVACHHERWDGQGYPRRLAGVKIPLAARIFAVVDAFDAMTQVRPYRQPVSAKEALQELDHCAGSQFDPTVIEAFLSTPKDSHLVPVRLAPPPTHAASDTA
jgi:HD-GYP domain-containing protein (c-di-GMP phosphodiesterase class II)